ALVVSALAGTWYVLALILGGWEFFRKQVLAENVFTFLDSAEFGGGHRHPAVYLLGALLLGLLPWPILLPGVVGRLWRRRGEIGWGLPPPLPDHLERCGVWVLRLCREQARSVFAGYVPSRRVAAGMVGRRDVRRRHRGAALAGTPAGGRGLAAGRGLVADRR